VGGSIVAAMTFVGVAARVRVDRDQAIGMVALLIAGAPGMTGVICGWIIRRHHRRLPAANLP